MKVLVLCDETQVINILTQKTLFFLSEFSFIATGKSRGEEKGKGLSFFSLLTLPALKY